MLIEKLRCESICLLSSHYAALSVNMTPEERRVSSAFFLSFVPPPFIFFFVVMVIRRDGEKTDQDCALVFFKWPTAQM